MGAPEMFDKKGDGYTNQVDVWAAGIIVWQLLIGGMPFLLKRAAEVKRLPKIIDRMRFPSHVDETAQDFILGCLKVDEDERLTTEEALKHPWLNDIPEIVIEPQPEEFTKKDLSDDSPDLPEGIKM